MLIGIPLAFYFSTSSIFLTDMGFKQSASSMSIEQMFSVGLPQVDATMLDVASGQWKAFWLLPAGMAAVVGVLFLFLTFWDKFPFS